MNTQRKADMMLVLVTLCWGVSYFFMDICLRELGPFTINMFRFCGAFVIAAAASFPKLRTVSRATLKYALIISIALVFVYTFEFRVPEFSHRRIHTCARIFCKEAEA